jgi:Ca-activated chloride channel homolog
VSDKKGRFVTNLTRDEFEVVEERRPQKIVEFAAESDLPLRLGVLIDTSNSIRERFRFQQEAAVEFINSVMRPEDRAVVVSFDTGPELIADLTNAPISPTTRKNSRNLSAICVRAAAPRCTMRSSSRARRS